MPNRTWTNEEVNILKQHYGKYSVEEIIKRFLPNKTPASIKWQVEKLKLGRKDYWSEWEIEALKIMRKCMVPSHMIGKIFNRTRESVYQKAKQLGIRSGKRIYHDSTSNRGLQSIYSKLDTKLIGSITEDYVRIKLSLLGFSIYIPHMSNSKIDLLIHGKNNVIKLQIKSASFSPKFDRYRAILQTKDKEGKFINYKKEDVDYFIAKCNGIDEFYIIPFDIGVVAKGANLYPHRQKLIMKGIDFEPYRNNFDLLAKAAEVDINNIYKETEE